MVEGKINKVTKKRKTWVGKDLRNGGGGPKYDLGKQELQNWKTNIFFLKSHQ